MKYLMESVREASRLDTKTDYEETKKQLLDCGLDQLNDVPHIVDAGCGSGAVSEIILSFVKIIKGQEGGG